MKIFSIILILTFIVFLGPVKAEFEPQQPTEPRPNSGEKWAGLFKCPEMKDKILLTFKEGESNGYLQIPFDNDADDLITDTAGICFDAAIITAFYDYRVALANNVAFCSIDTKYGPLNVGKDGGSPSSFLKRNGESRVCCPQVAPYAYEPWTWDRPLCCSKSNLPIGATSGRKCSNAEQGIDAIAYLTAADNIDNKYFFKAEELYSCGMDACMYIDGKFNNTETRVGYSKTQITSKNMYCYGPTDTGGYDRNPPVTPTTFNAPDGGEKFCIGGEPITKAEYDEWRDRLPVYVACKGYSNKTEADACVACLRECEACVYTSLGCINTTYDGVITTILRMGVGILGAVGIFRIMQAAILRQSADPKDIQESWDIIMSVIIGAVVMMGSLVILRVIGVNVLGILPFDF